MEVNDLPLHILLVHAVVVFVPLTALVLVLSAVWPAARRRLGIVTPIVAVVTAAVVVVAIQAGEWLQARVPSTPLIRAHTSIGPMLEPPAIAAAALAVAHYVWMRFAARVAAQRPGAARAVWIALAVLMIAVAAWSVVEVVLIGESGSRAVWDGSFSETPLGAR